MLVSYVIKGKSLRQKIDITCFVADYESYYMIFIILNYADKLLWKLSGYKIASLRNLKFSFRVKTAWWKTSTISGHALPEMHNRK